MDLNAISDLGFITALLSTMNLIGNIFWSLKLKSVQGSKELMETLTTINVAKDEVIKSKDFKIRALKEERKRLSFQFQQLTVKHRELEAELKTVKQFHAQIPLA